MSGVSAYPSPPFGVEIIQQLIPHRHPMLMLTGVTDIGEDYIVAEHHIGADMPALSGHFPDMPIVPGVLLAETAAQAAALMMRWAHNIGEGGEFLALTSIDQARFRRPVKPGDTVRVELNIARARKPVYKFTSQLFIGETRIATVDFSASLMRFDTG